MGGLVEGIGSSRCPSDKISWRGGPADVISSRGAWPTRSGAGGISLTR